jgi:hypothetical protein
MVDSLARDAAAATAQKEKKSLYARVYWYLDQVEYRGKIFSLSAAKWADMKDGFDDLTGLYPDLWNLNAYAYFACLAQDYKTMYGCSIGLAISSCTALGAAAALRPTRVASRRPIESYVWGQTIDPACFQR